MNVEGAKPGPGKYNAAAMKAFKDADPEVLLLIILNGKEGNGFEVVCKGDGMPPDEIAEILRHTAAELDKTYDAQREN